MILLLDVMFHCVGAPSCFLIIGYWVKRLGCEADHTPTSNYTHIIFSSLFISQSFDAICVGCTTESIVKIMCNKKCESGICDKFNLLLVEMMQGNWASKLHNYYHFC
jgi:hypothetical protein